MDEKLSEFISSHSKINQKSSDWKNLITYSVGGSEISTLLGENKFSSYSDMLIKKIKSVVNEKFGIIEAQSSNECIRWGVLFENIAKYVIEQDLGCSVKGDKICIKIEDQFRCSPDGYVIVKTSTDKRRILNNNESKKEKHVDELFVIEIKCPLLRKLTNNPPPYYTSQIQTGISASNIVNRAIFIDMSFRKCNLSELKYNPDYDKKYHSSGINYSKNKPYAWGCCVMKCFNPEDKLYTNYLKSGLILISDLSNDEFNRFLSDFESEKFKIVDNFIMFADGRGNYSDLYKQIILDEENILYVLPWKLMNKLYCIVEKDNKFLEKVRPIVSEFNKKVNQISQEVIQSIEKGQISINNLSQHLTEKYNIKSNNSSNNRNYYDNLQLLFDSVQ
jgi:hypothetical protein